MASQLPEYTDLQRTRVVNRADAAAPSIGSTQPITPREGLFDGLSIAQIVAGAAAAATSVLLMSKIGVVGSVIGAALSSVITVVSTQVYRRILTAGARKLTPGSSSTGTTDADASRTAVAYRPAASAWGADALDEGAYADNDATTYQPFGTAGYRSSASAGNEAGGTRIAPTKLRARAAAERSDVQRKIVAASVVAAILAVVLCAGIILITTAGEGLGTRPNSIIYEPLAQDESTTDGSDAQLSGQGADTSSRSSQDASTSQSSSSGQQGATNSPSSSTSSSSSSSSGSTGDSSASTDSSNSSESSNSSSSNTSGGDTASGGSAGSDSSAGTGNQGESNRSGSGTDSARGTAATS